MAVTAAVRVIMITQNVFAHVFFCSTEILYLNIIIIIIIIMITSRLRLLHCASMPRKITSRASRLVGASCHWISVCAPSAQSAHTNGLTN